MSTFGNTVSAFSNWTQLTRENRLRKPETIINDVARNAYSMGQLLTGKDKGEVVRGGKFISERLRLTSAGNFGAYTPGQQRNPSRGSTIQTITIPWRFYENNHPYTDAEIELNGGDDYAAFNSFKKSVDQELEADHFEGLEDSLWALPHAANMETGSTSSGSTATPGAAYSIPTLITEDGLVPKGTGTFTTIHGLSPSTYSNWRNQVSTFGTGLDDAATGIFAAFDQMMSKMDFQPPPGAKFYEKDAQKDVLIFTNTDGQNIFSRLLRSGNDQTRAGPQDPSYGMPQFKGLPVQRISALDTALLEQNPIGTLTTAAYPVNRPRYFWINRKYLFPIFHGKHFMEETPPISGGVQQRDTDTLFKVSWFNLACRSRKRQGIIVPAA